MNTVQGGTGGYSNSNKKGNIDLWEVRLFWNDYLLFWAVYLIMEGKDRKEQLLDDKID